MVNGSSPGPVPAAQAWASNCRLTRSSWRPWPQVETPQEGSQRGWRLYLTPDGGSRPASAQRANVVDAVATRVGSFSPWFARPRRATQVNVAVHQLAQSQMRGQGDRKQQSGIGHRAVIVEGDTDAVGLLAW